MIRKMGTYVLQLFWWTSDIIYKNQIAGFIIIILFSDFNTIRKILYCMVNSVLICTIQVLKRLFNSKELAIHFCGI